MSSSDDDLIEAAREVRERAYAPYSRFRVGAALRLKNGVVVTGVNLESCSYGLTVCAERNAVATAVAGGAAPGDIEIVAIAAAAERPTPPCGACRQVLAEHAGAGARVLLYNVRDGAREEMSLAELLPRAFDRGSFTAP